jgi:hypothetical protein
VCVQSVQEVSASMEFQEICTVIFESEEREVLGI